MTERDAAREAHLDRLASVLEEGLKELAAARNAARGHEAVLVSHQLPVWIARLDAEQRRFVHDPRKRQCGLASLTSLSFDDDRLVEIVLQHFD